MEPLGFDRNYQVVSASPCKYRAIHGRPPQVMRCLESLGFLCDTRRSWLSMGEVTWVESPPMCGANHRACGGCAVATSAWGRQTWRGFEGRLRCMSPVLALSRSAGLGPGASGAGVTPDARVIES